MLTITVQSAAVTDMLSQLQRKASNLKPAMQSIGQTLQTRISGRFETKRDPLGKSWAPWAESTKKSYPKDGNRKILDRYGDMLGSLNFKASPNSVSTGFGAAASKKGDAYAAYHEYGTKRMRRRGLLFADPTQGTISPADNQAILDIIGLHLRQNK
jgi:phage virion morphogenesis protein